MQFRHFTNTYFCDILFTEGKRNPGKQIHERGNQNENLCNRNEKWKDT